jgi:hypothetical protein
MSVYYIYQENYNKNIRILNIGDGVALGINSYGIDDYSYAYYYKDYLINYNKKVEVNEKYSHKDQSIKMILEKIRSNGDLKKDLIDSHILIVCLGYNDLVYKVSIERNMNNMKLNRIIKEIEIDYNEMISEIRKYYKKQIMVIGYFNYNSDNYYMENGIKKLNRILKSNKEVTFIDTYNDIKGEKYFPIPGIYYPNNYAYQLIARKIIAKTLEK